ncbi:MAG: beta strand repeat-containing protein [Candidatus Spyradosoma sp.]
MKSSKILLTSLLAAAAMSIPAFGTLEPGSVTSGGTWDNDASTYVTATKDSVGQYYFVAGCETPAAAISAESAISDNIVIGGTNVETDATKGLIITDSNQKCQALTGTITGVGILAIKASTGYGTSQLVFSGDVSGFSGKFYVNTGTAHTLRFMGTSTTALSGTGTIETNKTLIYEKSATADDTPYTIANTSISAQTLQFTGGANYTVSSTVTGNNTTVANNTLTISAGTTTFTGAVSKFGTISVASGAEAIFQGAFTNVVGTTNNNLIIAAGSNVSFQSTAAGGVLTANADSTVKFSSTASFTQLSGSGTIDLGSTGTLTLSPPSGSSKFNNWTGTVKLSDRGTTYSSNITLGNYGTTGSSVELAGYLGYFADSTTISVNLVLKNSSTERRNYAVNLMNGSSTGTITFSGSVSGDGTFQHDYKTGTTNVTQSYKFTGDLSGFSGTFQTVGNASAGDLIFGDGGNGVTGTTEGGTQKSVSGTGTINWKSGKNGALGVVYNYANDVFAANTFEGASTKIVKQGAGSLTLTGANTYTGGTTVEAGTLIAGSTSAFGSGALTVNAGAKVSANGFAVDLGAGNVTINGAYVVTTDGSLATSGTITFGTAGTLDVSGLTDGAYTIFGGTGTVSGLTQDKLYKESGRDVVAFADDSKSFTLTKGAVYNLTWTSTSGTWNADTTWQNDTLGGEANPTFADGDTVTFAAGDTAAKEISVVGAKDALAVNVTGGDYAFSAGEDGSLSVRDALTISSGASLTVNEGVLGAVAGGISLEADSTLKLVGAAINGMTNVVSGSGKVVLDKGSVIATEPTISAANVLTGSISVEKIGSSKISITAAQSYTGGTTILAGNIGVGHNEALGAGTITLNGSNAQITAHANNLNFDNAVTIGENGGIVHTQTNTMTLSGVLSGTGTLKKDGSGTLILATGFGGTGDARWTSGNLIVSAGTLQWGQGSTSEAVAGNVKALGENITVSAGANLKLWLWTKTKANTGTADKVAVSSKIILNGTDSSTATLSTEDGSYYLSGGIQIGDGTNAGNGTFTAKWAKGHVIGSLSGAGTFTINEEASTDSGTAIFSIAGDGGFSGTVNFNYSSGSSAGAELHLLTENALKNATVNLTSSVDGKTATLSLDAATVNIKGLTGTSAGRVVAATAGNTLAIATENGATNTFSGTVGTSTSAVGLSVSGEGTQTLLGTNYLGDVSVSGGELNLSGTNTIAGTVTVSGGVLALANESAIGTGSAVRISGGQLKVGNGTTAVSLNAAAYTIVLSDAYSADSGVAAIIGTDTTNKSSVALTADTKITIDDIAVSIAAEAAQYQYKIFDTTTIDDGAFTVDNFALSTSLESIGWAISGYNAGVLTLTIPEPSVFGLLAGLGALALAGTRRRRRKA